MGDDDAEDIRRAAAEYIQRWGVSRAAVAYFIDEVTRAAAIGDQLSARTWREIAAAARETEEDEGWRT